MQKPNETTTSHWQFVYIRVHRSLVLPFSTSPTNPLPTNLQSMGHLYVIEGRLEAISRFAGTTVDWIIKVAHLICAPLGDGQLYTHTSGTASDWYPLDRTATWQKVVQGDPLLPAIYEFEPNNPIWLSKISERHSHSLTTLGSESNSSTFKTLISRRDGGHCVVTGAPEPVIASHLIPKRMGTDGAKGVVTRFCGEQAAPGIHRYDPRIGVLLCPNLDSFVDHYNLGFYHVTGNTYTLHNFSATQPDVPVIGMSATILGNTAMPPLHLYSVTLSVYNKGASLPLKGVFDWHYIQCVIKTFGTPQYKAFPDIRFPVHPFKTVSDDSDDEYSDNGENEPPYPSYRFDRFLEEQGRRQAMLNRHKEVALWSSGIVSGVGESYGTGR